MRLKSALRRGVAAAVIAGIVVSSGIPAYAARWDIANGDITVKAGDTEGTNKVTQGETIDKDDTNTVITGESDKNTVTIDTSKGDVDVTFDDLKIDVSGKAEGDVSGDGPVDAGKAAVTVKGDHDAAIELDGDNELKSGDYNAGLEKNGHESEGTLTIKDDKGKDGSLTAEGGFGGAGIGGGSNSSQATTINISGEAFIQKATGGTGTTTAGSGIYSRGDLSISQSAQIKNATGGDNQSTGGSGIYSVGELTISGGTIGTAQGGNGNSSRSGTGGDGIYSKTMEILGGIIQKAIGGNAKGNTCTGGSGIHSDGTLTISGGEIQQATGGDSTGNSGKGGTGIRGDQVVNISGGAIGSAKGGSGGSGGGKPDSAMGGGTEVSKVDDALAAVDDLILSKLG